MPVRKDYELLGQLLSSVQRQIRLLGKENCEKLVAFTKILKTALFDGKQGKVQKITTLSERWSRTPAVGFSITQYVKMDAEQILLLSSA